MSTKGGRTMIFYKNLRGNSNVRAFLINLCSIDVLFFGTNRIYRYSYNRAGKYHVDNMKSLAIRGYGLNSYINKYCKYLYD